MNQSTPILIAPQKGITSIAHSLFMGAGIYALACAPAILLAEQLGLSQSFFHATQLVATILCFPAAAFFLWRTRGLRFNWARCLALVACVLSSLWLAFVIYVLLTLDFSAIG
jgi:ABC-type branched-subunit amino acid transport system permease subunit